MCGISRFTGVTAAIGTGTASSFLCIGIAVSRTDHI